MNNKSELSFWLRDVQKNTALKNGKSTSAYLNKIHRENLGLLKPASAISKTKEELMQPVEFAATTDASFQS